MGDSFEAKDLKFFFPFFFNAVFLLLCDGAFNIFLLSPPHPCHSIVILIFSCVKFRGKSRTYVRHYSLIIYCDYLLSFWNKENAGMFWNTSNMRIKFINYLQTSVYRKKNVLVSLFLLYGDFFNMDVKSLLICFILWYFVLEH